MEIPKNARYVGMEVRRIDLSPDVVIVHAIRAVRAGHANNAEREHVEKSSCRRFFRTPEP